MYCDFLGRAGDEVFNQLSKWQSMSGGLLKNAGRHARQCRQQIRRAALAGLDRACAPTSPA